ncbi:MAG: hypothetical protein A2864_01090 [Candidatus Woykebacteria bacterium RIFCSPHIGHO2_01_FULL_39_12]|uniref:Uncharacterized protein n=2 Tax=Candidatus Woykeibacteriota TaxID=1817899 RepID=A0A1G1WBY4_9BACT|nr:MAG: hypothetical protein A2134_00625 [Candidatus Woykebacteria bacterium RBG_16_39_9b]OGY27464.1 MAG: hypothetical protein A2864_01090 [Candidatus Woykebacteria bacterium RIFCSPHIGHO2_01_FULL_39_12]
MAMISKFREVINPPYRFTDFFGFFLLFFVVLTLSSLALGVTERAINSNTYTRFGQKPPSILIHNLQNNSRIVGSVVPLDIQVNDDTEISSVKIYVNRVHVATLKDTPFKWLWNISKLPPGTYELMVEADNVYGKSSLTSLSLYRGAKEDFVQ